MARKRIGYTIEARDRSEVRIAVNMYEKNDPEKRVLELAIDGDTSSAEYKAALAACKSLRESDEDADTKRLYHKVTQSPVVLTLCGGTTFKSCDATINMLDDAQRKLLNRIANKGLAIALKATTRAKIEEAFADAGISTVEEVTDGLYRLSVEKTEAESEDDD